MSFSHHKKSYNQTNKSSDRCKGLEDIIFTPFANIQQIEMYKNFSIIWAYVPFCTTYFIVDIFQNIQIHMYFLRLGDIIQNNY